MCLKSPGTDMGAAGFEEVSQDFWDTFYLGRSVYIGPRTQQA